MCFYSGSYPGDFKFMFWQPAWLAAKNGFNSILESVSVKKTT